MKIRQGFVSNSSSSSFVLVGIEKDANWLTEDKKKELMACCDIAELGDDEDDWCDFKNGCTDDDIMILEDDEDGAPNGKVVIGKELMDISDEDYECQCVEIKDIEKIRQKFKDKFNVDGDFKLYGVFRGC